MAQKYIVRRDAILLERYPEMGRMEFKDPTKVVTLFANKSEDAKAFILHRDYADHYSPVLRAAFQSDLIEGRTQVYRFQGDEVKDFDLELLVRWMYTGKAIIYAPPPVEDSLKHLTSTDLEIFMFFRLYALADRLCMTQLKDDIVHIVDWAPNFQNSPRTSPAGPDGVPVRALWYRYLWDHTTDNDQLRQAVVEQCVKQDDASWVDDSLFMPRQMLVEIISFNRKTKQDLRLKHNEEVEKLNHIIRQIDLGNPM